MVSSLALTMLLLPSLLASAIGAVDVSKFAREPDERHYYAQSIPRLSNLTREAFDALVREGRPAVIVDAAKGLAMEGWTCDYISKRFQRGKMRREYDWEANPNDVNSQSMGDTEWITDARAGLGRSATRAVDRGTMPASAPFYWGIRDYFHGNDVGPPDLVQEVLKLMQPPYFANSDDDNVHSMKTNSEFWFSAPGAGAKAHMDSHCISTLSINLSGRRQYRLAPVPRPTFGRSLDVVYDDGWVYEHGWTPFYVFNVSQGDAVLFPPGWLHETRNVGEECAASLTHQFTVPAPSVYWRTWLPRLTRTGDLNACWGEIADYAGLGRPPRPARGPAARQAAAARFAQLDAAAEASGTGAGTGTLSESELVRVGARVLQKEEEEQQVARWAANALAYHDLDGDGVITAEEFTSNYVDWCENQLRVDSEAPLERGGAGTAHDDSYGDGDGDGDGDGEGDGPVHGEHGYEMSADDNEEERRGDDDDDDDVEAGEPKDEL